MKTLKTYIGLGALAIAASAAPAIAETNQTATAGDQSVSVVHRIGSTIANQATYNASSAGYKWGNRAPSPTSANTWATGKTGTASQGYKWSQKQAGDKNPMSDYAGSAGYQWKTMGDHTQAGYRWRAQNTPEVAGYRWRAQNTPEVAGYRWRAQ